MKYEKFQFNPDDTAESALFTRNLFPNAIKSRERIRKKKERERVKLEEQEEELKSKEQG